MSSVYQNYVKNYFLENRGSFASKYYLVDRNPEMNVLQNFAADIRKFHEEQNKKTADNEESDSVVTKELANVSLISLGNRELTSKDCDNKDQYTEEEQTKIQEGLYFYQYHSIVIEDRLFNEAVLTYTAQKNEIFHEGFGHID